MRFADKIVIITGSGQGIGRVMAHAFAKEGACVVIGDIKEDCAQSVAVECRELGSNALAIGLDISNKQSVKDFVARIIEKYGRIDVLINNAAVFSNIRRMGPFEEITDEEWDMLMSVNLKGIWLLTKEIVPYMKKQKYGKIINFGSGVSLEGRVGYLHYVASKGGVVAMTRAMARELGDWNITVNTIMPSMTITEIQRATMTSKQEAAAINCRSIKRSQVPEDLVGPAMFFASSDSDFVTGQSLAVNGGDTMQ